MTRWEHQDVLDDTQERLEQNPDAMRIRRCSVEHPFGSIKSWMGLAQRRTFKPVSQTQQKFNSDLATSQ
ncbi:hypothetical protein GCM10007388_36610 [Pseudoduganella plicata]|uniref:Transposase DDE domain-containing protein n=1 Tax=Pseudoduganella plicata TaxID=321984 RepID=A0AA88C7W0_9BURK|nr:hypothetical protein GCM10007388_36610 [Pseudoduganella plicata]